MAGLLAFGPSVNAEVVSHRTLVLAVSEGTSGGIDSETALKKYKALADMIGKALQTKVSLVFVREFAQLEEGMQKQRFDIVMARPSDYPARGVRNYGYHFIATADPAGHYELIVPKNSPLQGVKDLKGRYFIFPEKQAYMTRFCRAALRDEGIALDNAHVFYVREQGAIPFSLKNGIADVGGVASYSGAYTKWLESGQRVLYESRAQPYFPVIASPSLDEKQRKQIQDTLTGMGATAAGQNELGNLSIKGFITTDEDRFSKLLGWLAVD
jgi:ABC-type phosphate/phosphonate transport system substrate-binding protein